MIDIHTHILPLVDDGSQSIEESLAMLKMQLDQGIDQVILTPHVQNRVQKVSSNEFTKRFDELQKIVKEQLPEMQLYLGAEVKYDEFKDTDYDKYVIRGTNYLLIEFSTTKEEPIVDVIYNLIAKGYQPIIAHIERYRYLSIDDIKRLKQDGALIQVNSNAVLGIDGFKYKRLSHKYIKLNLVDFIASDCHDGTKRIPNVKKALDKFKKIFTNKELKLK